MRKMLELQIHLQIANLMSGYWQAKKRYKWWAQMRTNKTLYLNDL